MRNLLPRVSPGAVSAPELVPEAWASTISTAHHMPPRTLNTRAKTFKADNEAAVKQAAEEWIQRQDTPETAN